MIFLLILNISSIQAVKGSKSEMAELRAAIVINTKKIIEKKAPIGKEQKATGKVSKINPGPAVTARDELLKTIGT